jgi:hypothetical protein
MPRGIPNQGKKIANAPEPDEFMPAQGHHNFFPFLTEEMLKKQMKWHSEENLPAMYTSMQVASFEVGEYAYLPYAVDEDNVFYYGKCIFKNKDIVRFHLLKGCETFSEVKNGEPKYVDIKLSKTKKDHLIKIKHPQPPQPPTQNNEKLSKQTEELITKTIQKHLKALTTDVQTLLVNIKATNMSADATLGTILANNLPPALPKVKVSKTANPALECTIANVPYKEDEDLNATVMIIVKKKGLSAITTNDFHAFRAIKKNSERKNNKPPLIIIAFRNNDMKNDFKKRHENDPNQHDFDQKKPENEPIYINENLTQTQRTLSYQAREFKRNSSYSYAWTRDGEVFVRKDENSRPEHITSQTELKNLLAAEDLAQPDEDENQEE